jgi:hypothetical protein
MNKDKVPLIVPAGCHPAMGGTDYAQTVDDLIKMLEPHRGKSIGLDNWDAELWIFPTDDPNSDEEGQQARIHLSVLN